MPTSRPLLVILLLSPLPAATQDWPMWGGGPGRNMVSGARGLPESWDAETGRNVAWRAKLGKETYGSPVVAGGKVFIGTNNDHPRDPATTGDKGVLMAFSAADGTFLWQAVSDKLPAGMDQDWPGVGVCSSPAVEGDRLFYLTNRVELVALDTEGFHDGENDGPFRGEAHTGGTAADVVWKLDLMAELGVVPHFATASSPALHGGRIYLHTGNGVDARGRVAAPEAPSFLAVDERTGRVAWSDASPGSGVADGQWSSPAVGAVGGRAQAIFGGGDGWLYGFDAASGEGLWRHDADPPAGETSLASSLAYRRTPILATPVLAGGIVYVGIGRLPGEGEGPGRFWALDAGRYEKGAPAVRWSYDGLEHTLSTAALAEGVVYVADVAGFLHALDAETGAPLWKHDTFSGVWGSPLVADGKVYLATADGDLLVLRAGREKKVLFTGYLGDTIYGAPVAAGGKLYVAAGDTLWALEEGAGQAQPEPSAAASGSGAEPPAPMQ